MQFVGFVVICALLAPCFQAAVLPKLKSSLASDNTIEVNADTIEQKSDNTIEVTADTIEQKNEAFYEINKGDEFVEGDMILSPEMRQSRNMVVSKGSLWPNRQLYYTISSYMTSHPKIIDKISTAVATFNNDLRGCINIQRTTNPNQRSIVVYPSNGCSANVGYNEYSMSLNLGYGCPVGSIMHEFIHSLGVLHEQSRSDRDKYVRILFENIDPNMAFNFDKANEEYSTNNTPYDYTSVMHYPAYAFSRNGQKTIEVLGDKSAVIGQREKLSSWDIYKLKKLYGCSV